jgi:hypothetical protein
MFWLVSYIADTGIDPITSRDKTLGLTTGGPSGTEREDLFLKFIADTNSKTTIF